jgi:hypothetical protein
LRDIKKISISGWVVADPSLLATPAPLARASTSGTSSNRQITSSQGRALDQTIESPGGQPDHRGGGQHRPL